MSKKKYLLLIMTGLLISLPGGLRAEDWRISFNGGAGRPVGQLTDWFKYGLDVQIGAGKFTDSRWYVEGIIHYARFTEDNLTGYAKDNLSLYLEHTALWVNAKYFLLDTRFVSVYYNLAGGPMYWKGIRGEILANETLVIPAIPARTLEEWNMGFRTGIGSEIHLGSLGIDLLAGYRFLAASLWPTMQEYIELDGVNGLQSLVLQTGIFYEF